MALAVMIDCRSQRIHLRARTCRSLPVMGFGAHLRRRHSLVWAVRALQLLSRGVGGSRLERRVVQRETQYAKSGRVSIAYQVVGDGPTDLILVPGFVSHVEVAWEEPRLAHFLGRLASFSRLIVFDKRGTGMSDPVDEPAVDGRADGRHPSRDGCRRRRAGAHCSGYRRAAPSACCSRMITRSGRRR